MQNLGKALTSILLALAPIVGFQKEAKVEEATYLIRPLIPSSKIVADKYPLIGKGGNRNVNHLSQNRVNKINKKSHQRKSGS